jgi:hypothetical protein
MPKTCAERKLCLANRLTRPLSPRTMNVPGLRSPHVKTGGIAYFGRLLDKTRLHAAGKLPAEYHENLGGGFDGFCCSFLGIDYKALATRTLEGGTDDEVLAWVFTRSPRPGDHTILAWNEFMRKRGWNDEASERLAMRKRESGFPDRDDIQTFFDYIDMDEGRDPRSS